MVSMTYAPDTILILLTFPIVFSVIVIHNIIQKKPLHIRHLLFSFGIPCIVAIIPILYLKYLSVHSWVFSTHPPLEKLNPFNVTLQQYVLYGGLPLLLAIFSLPIILKRANTLLYFLYSWLIANIVVEFILGDRLGFNRIRMFLVPSFVIWGILAAITVSSFSSLIHKHIRLIPKNLLLLFATVIIVCSGYYSIQYGYNRSFLCFCLFPAVSHPKKETMHAINWIQKNSTEHEAVMSGYVSGSLISAFAGNDVFTSKFFVLTNLPEAQENYANVQAFYLSTLPADYALELLKQNRVRYVLYGEDERAIVYQINGQSNTLFYPFLTEVFRSGDTIVYKIDP
jgi:hypothetical protein